jgi:hypothetical protein
MTQVIKYNDKEYKLPFAVGLSDEPTAIETVANRFSGEASCFEPLSSSGSGTSREVPSQPQFTFNQTTLIN